MVNKNKVWANGDVLDASDVNENSLQPLSNMDLTDNTAVTETGTGYVTKRTLAIGANQISNFIIIRFDIRCWMATRSNNEGYQDTAKVQLTIDSSQKLELTTDVGARYKYANADGGNNNNDYSVANNRMCCFKYTPTSDEKTNGFTIDLDLKVVTGGKGASAKNDYWEVWGC